MGQRIQNKTFCERLKEVKKTRWIRFGIVSLIFFFWVVWLNNYWVLFAYPLLFDIYITLYIPWNWWKKSKSKSVRTVMSWVDSIVYALILVYFIFIYVGQNYKIPSSSLEKTLLVGDYLWVNKMCYGPRVPQTPLHFPLVQNTFPIINTKSYFEKPQWEYHRLKGYRKIERNDIVVFNFPAGDTITFNVQNPDYYTVCYKIGESVMRQNLEMGQNAAFTVGSREFAERCMALGREYVKKDKAHFGEIMYRPVDRRENYVKRCIGLPGEYLKIKDNKIYIDGNVLAEPENVQYNYFIRTNGSPIANDIWDKAGVSNADRAMAQEVNYNGNKNLVYAVPLTYGMVDFFKSLDFVEAVESIPVVEEMSVYPINKSYGWTRADYAYNLPKGIWIPKKGGTLKLNLFNLPIYERVIKNYEGNDLEVRDGIIYINGKATDRYRFKMDYYWMMGDNRDNSSDSRYWGFVPEDHIVGTPMFVIISAGDNGLRWNRIFKDANPDK